MKVKGLDGYANTYILKRFDGVMLIDPAFNYEEIQEKVKGLKIWGILLTHGHSSHFGLIGRFNCPVYLHKDDYFTFIDDDLNGFNHTNKTRHYDLNMLDLKLIDESTKIQLVDQEIEVIHTPGHTKGSVCYYFDNILYTGDTLTIKGPGFTKRHGNSTYQIRKSIKNLYNKYSINTKVYPGHGPRTTLLEIRQKNKKIRSILK